MLREPLTVALASHMHSCEARAAWRHIPQGRALVKGSGRGTPNLRYAEIGLGFLSTPEEETMAPKRAALGILVFACIATVPTTEASGHVLAPYRERLLRQLPQTHPSDVVA